MKSEMIREQLEAYAKEKLKGKMVAVTAVAKLTVIDLTAKVNPVGGGTD